MSRRRELALLWRQIFAHDAYVARRTVREGLALGLAHVGRWLPGAARLARRLHPRSKEAHQVLAARAARRGNVEAAARYRAEYEALAHNTLETSVLGALRTTLAWRRTRRSSGGVSEELTALLEKGRLREAAICCEAAGDAPGLRVDGWLRVAEAAERAGERTLAVQCVTRALRLDDGRADLWTARGRLARAEGQRAVARDALERADALEPNQLPVLLELGRAWAGEDHVRSRRYFARLLERDPDCDEALRAVSGEPVGPPRPGVLAIGASEAMLSPGERLSLEVRVETAGAGGDLFVLEPFGAGLRCEPHGRVRVEPGSQTLTLQVEAARPDAINGGEPWRLALALWSGGAIVRADLRVRVPEPETPGVVHYLITEDHELYDEREATDPRLARITLVEKSRLAEDIANEQGARWTHMVDVASQALVEWAAEQSKQDEWPALRHAAAAHLSDAVARGNDLSLHLHAFHDPESGVFCHDFDPATDRVTTDAEFLETPLSRRGFWTRAFPTLGNVDGRGTRAWATWRAIGWLEAVGRLGDSRYRVAMFRAGSFDFGENAAERTRSLALLARLGIPADSDVPKPRLYHKVVHSPYPVSDDIRSAETDPRRVRMLEIRPEFNIEADFLSDVRVLNGYIDQRVASLREPGGRVRPGVHLVCCMTHDKFINWRMGRQWDSLEPDYGDWVTIRDHLRHVAERHPDVRFSTVHEAVIDWYEHNAPQLMAWREEEIVEVGEPGAERERYRYPLRLVGRDIAVGPDRPRTLRVLPPAWVYPQTFDAWIERDGERVDHHRLAVEPRPLEFTVDSREARWELVVEAASGAGITAVPDGAGGLRLRSALHYRRAAIHVPAALSPDGRSYLAREVRLEPAGDGYEAAWSASAPSGGSGGTRDGSGRGGAAAT